MVVNLGCRILQLLNRWVKVKPNDVLQWIPDLNLTNQGRLNIRNNEEIDDFIIPQAMNLLQKQYPTITTQPPSLAFSTGYSYCPSEAAEITHTGAPHWVLLSSMY